MSVLKFRVIYEEDDSVFRDIDIKPAHSFNDFEAVIHASYDLPSADQGMFFMSNDNWQKGRTIYPTEVKEVKGQKKGKLRHMTELPPIVSFLDDPHQHFIYEYHGNQEFSFLIELLSVGGNEDYKTNYPVCVRTQGASPFKKEDSSVHFTKHIIPLAADDEAEIEEEDEEEEEGLPPVIMEAEEDADSEEFEAVEEEANKHDLMEGDAMEEAEDDVESVEDDLAGGDEFNPEDFNEGSDEFDEEDIR